MTIILSFDVEEHHRIEAAAHLSCPPDQQSEYRRRMEVSTRWLLDELAVNDIRATFFVVGEIAHSHPDLVRDMQRAGHEVASHSMEHRNVHRLNADSFRDDVRRSKDALEDVTGVPVLGYRAPTFSVTRATAWAVDVLAEMGFRYDSSIYPVRHDRYGVPSAPRAPFQVKSGGRTLLEIPPATCRLAGANVPVGGGGYFRLFPLWVMERAFTQARSLNPAVTMLYFHPWEFDPDQPRLPLGRLSAWRTYVGTGKSRRKLSTLLSRHRFARAIDVAESLETMAEPLPIFDLAGERMSVA
jgi:polysaccharide deacetylase family protein (PEP-CTERM system associated)